MTTTTPDPCSRSKAAKVDFANVQVEQNNLGGQGPDSGAEELRFTGSPSAGTSSTGEPFDIVVTTVPGFEYMALTKPIAGFSPDTHINGHFVKLGVTTDLAVIYAGALSTSGGESSFKFSFVQPGTNIPVILREVHMSIFDLDGAGNPEFASSKGYRGFAMAPDTTVEASTLPDGRAEFRGTVDADTPTGVKQLTDEQKAASVMYVYTNVASFELNYGRLDRGKGGLLFGFESSLEQLCEP